jgi:TetR/AcrR family transcriptional repressor of nem operon
MGRTSDARDRLLNAAMELMYTAGYQGVGIEDLCKRAGVKKGSFYYFFRSKSDLALAALELRWSLTRQHMIEPILSSQAPPLERIRLFFDTLANVVAQEKTSTGHCGGCAFGNLSAEMSSRDVKIRGGVRHVFDRITEHFERVLEEASVAGDLEEIAPRENAQALVAFMEGLLLLSRTYDDASFLASLGQKAIAIAGARRLAPLII